MGDYIATFFSHFGAMAFKKKCEKEGYPAVIMPLLSGPRMLFNRNILYTAVTRAKKCVAIVGDEHTVRHMIENEKQQKRYTSLDLRIKEMHQLQ